MMLITGQIPNEVRSVFIFFPIGVKYTQHKIYHFNHFKVCIKYIPIVVWPPSISRTLLVFPTETRDLLYNNLPPHLPTPQPRATTVAVCMNFSPVGTSYKWNHTLSFYGWLFHLA